MSGSPLRAPRLFCDVKRDDRTFRSREPKTQRPFDPFGSPPPLSGVRRALEMPPPSPAPSYAGATGVAGCFAPAISTICLAASTRVCDAASLSGAKATPQPGAPRQANNRASARVFSTPFDGLSADGDGVAGVRSESYSLRRWRN